jgi:hypothetical protein
MDDLDLIGIFQLEQYANSQIGDFFYVQNQQLLILFQCNFQKIMDQ